MYPCSYMSYCAQDSKSPVQKQTNDAKQRKAVKGDYDRNKLHLYSTITDI